MIGADGAWSATRRALAIDFEGLTGELKLLLGDSRKQVAGLDLKGVSAQWQRTGAAIETLVASPEIKQTFVTLNATLVDLRATLAKLDGQVAATGTDVQATLAQTQATLQNFSATATTLRNFINAQQGLGEGAGEAFGKLAEAGLALGEIGLHGGRYGQAGEGSSGHGKSSGVKKQAGSVAGPLIRPLKPRYCARYDHLSCPVAGRSPPPASP